MNATIYENELWKDGELPPDTMVLDVRTPAEFRESHIPGSRNIPLADLPKRLSELEQAGEPNCIALVCRTGKRASEALKTMAARSNLQAQVLDGGIISWMRAGLPVNQGKKAVTIERQVRIAAGSLTVLGVALGLLVHPGFLGLAAFVGAGLVFAGVTDTCGMGMMLAKMPWNRASADAPIES